MVAGDEWEGWWDLKVGIRHGQRKSGNVVRGGREEEIPDTTIALVSFPCIEMGHLLIQQSKQKSVPLTWLSNNGPQTSSTPVYVCLSLGEGSASTNVLSTSSELSSSPHRPTLRRPLVALTLRVTTHLPRS